jgi:esterase/lipase superfamily enzyme
MRREYHRWYSDRLKRELGVVVLGHWGPPLLMFPTSGGDEEEYERQGMIDAIGEFIDRGTVKAFCVNVNHGDSFANHRAHPFHRSWMQRQYDDYIRHEVIPFARAHCQSPEAPVWTMGASLGGYHAVNTLFKHPDVVKRCFALSGVYDMKRFMNGAYDDNFYFNNPVDYLQNLSDPWVYGHLATCDIHLVTGTGQWEKPAPTYRLSQILASKNIRHSLDDWGPQGGHDWPYWKNEMREYVARLF